MKRIVFTVGNSNFNQSPWLDVAHIATHARLL